MSTKKAKKTTSKPKATSKSLPDSDKQEAKTSIANRNKAMIREALQRAASVTLLGVAYLMRGRRQATKQVMASYLYKRMVEDYGTFTSTQVGVVFAYAGIARYSAAAEDKDKELANAESETGSAYPAWTHKHYQAKLDSNPDKQTGLEDVYKQAIGLAKAQGVID